LEDLRNSQSLVRYIAQLTLDKKGDTISILDLRKISSMVDFFIIITATGETHARALADVVRKKLRDKGIRNWHLEGYSYGHWILLDYVDVVVHIFMEEERKYYGIESLWGDAPMEKIV